MYKTVLFLLLFSVIHCKKIGIRNLVKVNPQADEDGAILYEVEFDDKIELSIPEECLRIGMCKNVPNFPHETFKELIKIMITDKVPFHRTSTVENHIDYTDEQQQELCESKVETIIPQAVKIKNDWLPMINSKYENVQSFYTEACDGNINDKCSDVVYFNRSYEGHCKQKYTKIPMVVLNEDANNISNIRQVMRKHVDVPTCCSCVAVKIN